MLVEISNWYHASDAPLAVSATLSYDLLALCDVVGGSTEVDKQHMQNLEL